MGVGLRRKKGQFGEIGLEIFCDFFGLLLSQIFCDDEVERDERF
jgi:hypothetical protein